MPHRKQLNGRKLERSRLNGHELNGHKLNGHKLNGHKLDGHKLDGHKLDGHKLDGHKLDGHKLDGHKLDGHKLDGHKRDGHERDGNKLNGDGLNGQRIDEAGPLYVVRRSGIHGRGVFAARDIAKGARVLEYRGVRISYDRAAELYSEDEDQPTHTFLFEIDEDTVIDAGQRGNAARWINHSCAPNCEAVDEAGRIYIEAIRRIRAGEELGYDYNITLEERHTAAERRRWECLCGARICRGTLLADKR